MNFIKGKLVAIILYQTILGSATNIFPSVVVDFCLQLVAIKFTITHKDDITPFRQQWFHSLNQLTVHFFGKMSFFTLDNYPNQRQCPLFVDDTDHQDQTVATDFAAIYCQHQWPTIGQPVQQNFNEGHEISLCIDVLVLQIATELLDAAFYFAWVWRFFGHCAQLTFSTANDTTDHACQRIHMSGLTTSHLFWLNLPQTFTYETIDTIIITHGISPLIYAESRSLSPIFLFCHIFLCFLKSVR